MSKNIITVLGVIVAFLPSVSIPFAYKSWIITLFGLAIAGINYYQTKYKRKIVLREAALRRQGRDRRVGPTTQIEPVVENQVSESSPGGLVQEGGTQ